MCYNAARFVLADIGEQDTADFSFNSASGACVLSLKGKGVKGLSSRCDISFINVLFYLIYYKKVNLELL